MGRQGWGYVGRDGKVHETPTDPPAMTDEPGLRAAEFWHKALADDPLLPDCSGTHMLGYGYCQRLAAVATSTLAASDGSLDVERLRQAYRNAAAQPMSLGTDKDTNLDEDEWMAEVVAAEYERLTRE